MSDFNDKDIKNLLKGDVEIPESLRPENIEKMLENEEFEPKVIPFYKKAGFKIASVAAACVIIVAGALTINNAKLGSTNETKTLTAMDEGAYEK
nr:hypothetical protein [Lachnospiraceae bacterium]